MTKFQAVEVRPDLEVLFELLAIDSVWGNERAVAEHLRARLPEWGLEDVTLVEVPDRPGRPSVGARLHGSGGGRSALLNGHIDIYELSADWTRDPFVPEEVDGRIYGAGVADMKAGTAAAIAAIRRIARSGTRLRGDVVLQCVSCHFEGGLGTGALLREGFVADAAVCGEPTDNAMGIAQRGTAYLVITTIGKQAHTVAKGQGVNAIETMQPVLDGLRRLADELPYEPHPYLKGGTIYNIGTIHGGTKHNQVPDRCVVTCDLRLLPSQDPYDVRRRVEAMVAQLRATVDPQIQATVEFSEHWLSGPRLPYEITEDAPLVRAVDEAAAEVTGRPPVHLGLPYWTDMRPLADAGIPAVNLGPGTPPYNWADEWVEAARYLETVSIYEAFLRRWCG
jgi:acetylornithine deacetylase/succinyl-diaminopimelate desuccinylase-like protein